MKIKQLGYLIREGIRGVFSHGFRSVASITVIAACLIIMGSFALVGVNVDHIIKDMESESQILAFVDENLSQDDARLLEGAIRSIGNVREVKFVTREEAMENFKKQHSESTVFGNLESSVLRNRYVVYLNDITRMEETKKTLEDVPGVDRGSVFLSGAASSDRKAVFLSRGDRHL